MFSEFKTFIARGNVLDLAVGVIIGAAFGKIVASLTDDIIMPVVGALFGGLDFSNYFIALKEVPENVPHTLAAVKAAGIPAFAYGSFISAIINFLILAYIIFLIVRSANKLIRPAAPAATEVDLLTEIRDELRKK